MMRCPAVRDLLIAVAIASTWSVVAICTRPILAIDETRYASVAWEMHTANSFLVPRLNGELYSHKPPLLFWLINGLWWLFGVSEFATRVVGPSFGVTSVLMTYYLGRKLWPEQAVVAGIAALLLVSGLVWSVFASLTMFDTGLCFFVLLFAVGLLRLSDGHAAAGVITMGLALGGGLLQKGPVILLHTLPVALLAVGWIDRSVSRNWWRWHALVLASVLLGLAIAACWVLPAIYFAGEEYAEAILWKQSAGRMANSFAHQRPFWFYLPLLPVLLFPWTLSWPAWRQLKTVWQEPAVRLCLIWIVATSFVFSCLSGKQIHYLLPVIPLMALLMARLIVCIPAARMIGLCRLVAATLIAIACGILSMPFLAGPFPVIKPLLDFVPLWAMLLTVLGLWIIVRPVVSVPEIVRRITVTTMLAWIVMNGQVFSRLAFLVDLRSFANEIAHGQSIERPVAFLGRYQGQFHFLGRLKHPIVSISSPTAMANWVQEHPEGYVVLARETDNTLQKGLIAQRTIEWDETLRRIELWNACFAPLPPEAEIATGTTAKVGVAANPPPMF